MLQLPGCHVLLEEVPETGLEDVAPGRVRQKPSPSHGSVFVSLLETVEPLTCFD